MLVDKEVHLVGHVDHAAAAGSRDERHGGGRVDVRRWWRDAAAGAGAYLGRAWQGSRAARCDLRAGPWQRLHLDTHPWPRCLAVVGATPLRCCMREPPPPPPPARQVAQYYILGTALGVDSTVGVLVGGCFG